MKYWYRDLGFRSRGEVVEITVHGSALNVLLMDSANFNSYKNGRRNRYIGGYFSRSPIPLQIPRNGHWYVVTNLGGYSGRFQWAVQVLPGRLPAGQHAPLASMPSLIQNPELTSSMFTDSEEEKTYDVFISHASEDKDAVVRELAHALQDAGLMVWYDEFELRIGDSLRRKIDKGLANSRFGVVVLSHSFFEKNWPNYELDGLVTRGVSGEQIILPIWHNISKTEVISYSPSLADKLARSTSEFTVDEIATEIAELINFRSDVVA